MEVSQTKSNLKNAFQGLSWSKKQLAGRNNRGRQTVFHRGGGRKLRYRVVDFRRVLHNVPALVRRIEYDPVRTARVALLSYANEILAYILAPKGLEPQAIVYACERQSVDGIYYLEAGSAHYLSNFAVGSFIHNIQTRMGAVATYMRAFNASAQLLRKSDRGVILKLKSGEHRLFPFDSIVSLGVPAEGRVLLREPTRRAGLNRNLGWRPIVRGCAMNPVDHPHGGGAGKGHTKRGVFSPWGKFSKGTRTAKYKLVNSAVIKSRRTAMEEFNR